MKHQLLKLNLRASYQSRINMNYKNKKQRGFTLIESTVAIIILIIGVFSVISFFPLSLGITGNANSQTIATNLAQSKIEEMRSLNYSDITIGTFEAKQRLSTSPTSYLYNYQRETTVDLVNSDFNTSVTDVGFKKITVTSYWQSPISHSEKSYSVISIATDF